MHHTMATPQARLTIEERRRLNTHRKSKKNSEKHSKMVFLMFAIAVQTGSISNVEAAILQTLFKLNLFSFSSLDRIVANLCCSPQHTKFQILHQDQAEMLLERGFTVIDNFLSQEETEQVREHATENKHIQWQYPSNHGRDDLIFFLNPQEYFFQMGISREAFFEQSETELRDRDPFLFLLKRVLKLRDDLAHVVQFSSNMLDYEFQLASYAPGASGYKLHLDASADDTLHSRNGRVLSAILYLQRSSHRGGKLMVLEDRRPITPTFIEPIGGRVVVFFSGAIPHQVKATRDRRLAFTTWFTSGS